MIFRTIWIAHCNSSW